MRWLDKTVLLFDVSCLSYPKICCISLCIADILPSGLSWPSHFYGLLVKLQQHIFSKYKPMFLKALWLSCDPDFNQLAPSFTSYWYYENVLELTICILHRVSLLSALITPNSSQLALCFVVGKFQIRHIIHGLHLWFWYTHKNTGLPYGLMQAWTNFFVANTKHLSVRCKYLKLVRNVFTLVSIFQILPMSLILIWPE